jgi:hypothetical protein
MTATIGQAETRVSRDGLVEYRRWSPDWQPVGWVSRTDTSDRPSDTWRYVLPGGRTGRDGIPSRREAVAALCRYAGVPTPGK